MMFFEHIHPKLVHFPIALFISAWMFDMLSLSLKKEMFYNAARLVFNLAVFFACAAVISGWVEASVLHLNHPILSAHRLGAFVLTGISVLTLIMLRIAPQQYQRSIFTASVCMCCLLVAVTGNYGGILVFNYGVGVNP